MTDNEAPKLGPSFPFMEAIMRGDHFLTYDGIIIKFVNDCVATITYMQGDTPIYAYTVEAGQDRQIQFEDMEGKVKMTYSVE